VDVAQVKLKILKCGGMDQNGYHPTHPIGRKMIKALFHVKGLSQNQKPQYLTQRPPTIAMNRFSIDIRRSRN